MSKRDKRSYADRHALTVVLGPSGERLLGEIQRRLEAAREMYPLLQIPSPLSKGAIIREALRVYLYFTSEAFIRWDAGNAAKTLEPTS